MTIKKSDAGNKADQIPEIQKSWRTAQTRANTCQISAHLPEDGVKAFKILALENDKDIHEQLAEAMNLVFAHYGKPTRINIVSGRRKRPQPDLTPDQ